MDEFYLTTGQMHGALPGRWGLMAGAADMGIIWVRCPATGKQASTGIEADVRSFAAFPKQLEPARCPACGIHHRWAKEDASLIDATPTLALLLKEMDNELA